MRDIRQGLLYQNTINSRVPADSDSSTPKTADTTAIKADTTTVRADAA